MNVGTETNGVDNGSSVVRLRIPARAEYITLCRLALTGLGRIRQVPDETLADLKLALTEATSNSVRHAYSSHGDGHVDIVYELQNDRLTIEVLDNGGGFEPLSEASLTDGELSEGGLGIAIIRAIADELEIESSPVARGSRLRFVKLLH
jgi:serine/threonine-protein kinase RsbW